MELESLLAELKMTVSNWTEQNLEELDAILKEKKVLSEHEKEIIGKILEITLMEDHGTPPEVETSSCFARKKEGAFIWGIYSVSSGRPLGVALRATRDRTKDGSLHPQISQDWEVVSYPQMFDEKISVGQIAEVLQEIQEYYKNYRR